MGHTFTNHLYHVVFSTKERRPLIHADVRPRLLAYMGGIADRKQGTLLTAGGTDDHVHLLVRVLPDVAVSAFVSAVKSNSSRWLSQTFPHVRPFAWQAGYSSFSVSESNWSRVAAYIRAQEEHHRRQSFADELAALLRKHGVEFDPQHYLD